MSEVVDAIVAELIVRDVAKYERDFDRATAAHGRFTKSMDKMKAQTFDLAAEGQKYKAGADKIAQAEEQVTQRVTRTRKKRADDAVAQDEREVASAKKAAKAKADAEVVEAQRSARIREAVERGINNRNLPQGSGANLGRAVPREGTGQSAIPPALMSGPTAATEAAAEREINHILADRFDLEQRSKVAEGAIKRELSDQIDYLRRINTYKRAGLSDDQAALRAEREIAAIEKLRSRPGIGGTRGRAGGSDDGLLQKLLDAIDASNGSGGGSDGLFATIAGAVGVGVAATAIQSAIDYGNALADLSDQLGLTVEDLQTYQKLAAQVGVDQQELTSAFGQFASSLGRAQQNEQEQVKVFKALGVNIKAFASAGDALPTVIDRISQIKDPAQRAAVETRLFGEEGRKLDALLSGGADRVNELSRALQETGRVLSAKEIQELDQTARKLSEVKSQLQVDFARVVAGNSDAIIGLANAFSVLTDRMFKAIRAFQIFHQYSDDPEKAVRLARSLTPEGRKVLLRENEAEQDAIKAQIAGGSRARAGSLIDNGRDVSNSPEAVAARTAVSRTRLAELQRQHREIRTGGSIPELAAPVTPPPVQAGTVNTRALNNLGTPAGPKGKSADQIARDEEQRTRQFNDQLAQAQADFLRAQEQMTGSAERRAEIELQLLKTAYDARLADIDSQAKRNKLAGADAKLEDARAAELKAAEKKAFDANAAAIEQDKQLDIARTLTQKQQDLLDAQQVLLGAQLAVAQTAAERRRLELALLANAKEQERNRLNGIISATKPGDPAAAAAEAQLGTLDQRFDAQRRSTEFANRGPLKQYLDALPQTADQVNEALENAAVGGLQDLNDGLTDAVKKMLHLSGAAGDFLGKLIEIGIQRELLIPLANELFPTGTSGGGGGLLGFLGGLFGGGGGGGGGDASSGLAALGGLLGGTRAAGGNVVAGVPYLVGENGPEPVIFGASGRVYPNGALPSLRGATGGLTVIAPQHFDLSGVVMTESLIRRFEARNREYANGVAAQAGRAAVAAAPGKLQQIQTLGN